MVDIAPLRVLNKDSNTQLGLGTHVVSVNGPSALTILAGGGGTVKYRIYQLQIGSDTAGLVAISDGLGSYYVPENGTVVVDFGHIGIKQTTANTQLTATLAASNLSVVAIYKLDA